MEESMMEPSTIASGESRSSPSLTSEKAPPFFSFSSTSFTAEEPISRPTTFLLFEKNTTHPVHLTHSLLRLAPDVESRLKLQPLRVSGNCREFRLITLGARASRPRLSRDRRAGRPRSQQNR